MPRKLKAYHAMIIKKHGMVHPNPGRGHINQIHAVVAATSQKAAAELMCVSLSDFRWNGGGYDNDHPNAVLALAEPGVVFYEFHNQFGHDGLTRWEGQEDEQAKFRRGNEAIVEAKVRQAERAVEWAAEKERRAECNQAAVMWAQRLNDDFGLTCEPAGGGEVSVKVPAEYLHGLLSELSGILRDVGIDDLLQPNEPNDS